MRFIICTSLLITSLLQYPLGQDYPSCIGLDLATNYYFSGDVVSQETCEEACLTLFPDATGDIFYDVSSLEDGMVVEFCDCGSEGVLCEDVVGAKVEERKITNTTTEGIKRATTTVASIETTTTQALRKTVTPTSLASHIEVPVQSTVSSETTDTTKGYSKNHDYKDSPTSSNELKLQKSP